MALHVPVNGKFGKVITRLDDPERVRKDLESQRRITRLQQVREKSNHLARKIREDVAAEKKRQIKNLEDLKQKELNAWREHVLVKKHQDYRSAIFQVGAAHQAAKEENERNEALKQQKIDKIKNARKQAMKRSGRAVVELRPTTGMKLNVEGRVTAGTQTPALPIEDKENRLAGGVEKSCHKDCSNMGKTKANNNAKCGCPGPEEDSPSEDDASILPTECVGHRRSSPVIVDVDIDDSDGEELHEKGGMEIGDRFMQTNRKFSHIVRTSPDTSPERTPESPRRRRFTQITDLVKRTANTGTVRSECVAEDEPRRSVPPSPTKSMPPSPRRVTVRAELAPPPVAPSMHKSSHGSPKKTQTKASARQPEPLKRTGVKSNPRPAKVIDAGIQKNLKSKTISSKSTIAEEKPREKESQQKIPSNPQFPMPPFPYPPPTGPCINPYPQPYAMTYTMPYPMHPQFMPPPPPQPPHPMYAQPPLAPIPVPAVTAPPSMATTSCVSTTTFPASQEPRTTQSQSGRVQFYDHGNKYHRTYDAPTQSVHSTGQDSSQPNAMDNARVENQLRELREQELDNLRKISESRGQKALEREQVRRDCAELTEKLDALVQQQPQLLPSDVSKSFEENEYFKDDLYFPHQANFIASHRYADAAVRREQKMNEAMEEMLLRPTIITCPEVKDLSPLTSAKAKSSRDLGAINVGACPPQKDRLELGSSESCTEILLDYVDDQSNQLRSDLKSEGSNTVKCMKLRNLLDRIEQIRMQLLEELKAGEAKGSKSEKAQDMINSIRQERADILFERTRNLNERESELNQKEALLEKRLRKFYKETKGRKATGEEEITPKEEKPVEIIIKVRSDGTVKQYLPKGKSKFKANVVSSEKDIPLDTPIEEEKQTEEEATKRPPALDQRQISIDSNSTAYRSLPPVSYKSLNPGPSSAASSRCGSDRAPLHPTIVNYIQRLLGMSRQSIDNLGVSSSEVPTPPASIIDSSRNKSQAVESNETIIDQQRLEQVQTFISENRSFINDLEDSLRMRQKAEKNQRVYEKETSSKTFDEIWNERLARNQEDSQSQSTETRPKDKVPQKSKEVQGASLPQSASSRKGRHLQGGNLPQTSMQLQGEHGRRTQTAQKPKQELEKSKNLQSVATKSIGKLPPKSGLGVLAEKSKPQGKEESTKQVERYERLAENCTQRIAELTDLITKVREEKQRLVEVTLTSNSDGERQSTEYYDLPTGQVQRQSTQSTHSRSRTVSDRSDSQTPSTSEALPLQKNKPTAASRDSGIADSRPLTAMGQVTGMDVEPISLPTSSHSNAQRHRTKAPPATIRRYSPQLDAEDLAHELSTIAEVETPGQSHIVAATPVPQPFPTFEQYAREMNLDLTQFDANQSRKMELEFNDLVRAIHERTGGSDYREFPSINAYLHNMRDAQCHGELDEQPPHDQTTLAPEDLMRQLRLLDVHLQEFPNRREYLQKLLANAPPDQRQLIDSASLESSDSLNVEEELRQRNILKTSFRRASTSSVTPLGHDVASSTRRESVAPNTNDLPNESGIDPLGSSDTDFSEQRRPTRTRDRQTRSRPQGEDVVSSTDVSWERPHRKSRLDGGTRSHNNSQAQDASQIGRSLNLREFLTRELLKHRGNTGETSMESSDESLKGHFLKSVISSLSPASSPYTPGIGVSYATGITNDRQKTSTPVGSFSMPDKSRSMQSAATLFSGESRISLVHYPDGTPPVPYEQQQSKSTNETRQTLGHKVSGQHRRSPRK
ncbi:hypothetical protein KR074_008972 [Drosophila pseudoananassae]|nr:hypothetical protein KR074_008972 [Drosophila pseudoananassae]